MLNLFRTARVRAWIAGLARPPAPTRERGPGVLAFFHPELEPIGESVNVWRLRNERDRDYAFRIAVELCDRLNKLEAALDVVVAYERPNREPPND